MSVKRQGSSVRQELKSCKIALVCPLGLATLCIISLSDRSFVYMICTYTTQTIRSNPFSTGSRCITTPKCFSAVLLSFVDAAAVLVGQLPENELEPLTPNNKTTMDLLFKRAISCTCDNTAYCCWKFEAGADTFGGLFCCPNTQDLGGGCCGNGCCPYGQYCAWADSLVYLLHYEKFPIE